MTVARVSIGSETNVTLRIRCAQLIFALVLFNDDMSFSQS